MFFEICTSDPILYADMLDFTVAQHSRERYLYGRLCSRASPWPMSRPSETHATTKEILNLLIAALA